MMWCSTSATAVWAPRRMDHLGFCSDHIIGVINLARLTGDRTILPTAFLACICAVRSDVIVCGFRREDGAQEMLSPNDLALYPEANSKGYYSVSTKICTRKVQAAIQGLRDHTQILMSGNPFLSYVRYIKGGELGLSHETFWRQLPQLLAVDVPDWSGQLAEDEGKLILHRALTVTALLYLSYTTIPSYRDASANCQPVTQCVYVILHRDPRDSCLQTESLLLLSSSKPLLTSVV
ncbi:hypothetical protein C8Q80DRAFT_1187934 [Daedaleopsis nitida]|nr:hypothetical protein C8Q80DRAFT_1187934 [Daedaleopsis nitida]